MSTLNLNTILIIEPKKELAAPYSFLPQEAQLFHVTSTPAATQALSEQNPDVVVISASYSPVKIFHLLEAVKEKSSSSQYLIPILMMIDLTHKSNFIPGTHWGEKLGIINTLSTKKEVLLVLERICQEQKSLGF